MDGGHTPFAAVAGAGRGIGRATALALARQGYEVLVGARSPADLESLAAEAAREHTNRVLVQPLDVRSEQSVEAFFERARNEAAGIDTLVVTAGTAYLGGIASAPHEASDMAATNFLGTFNCLHFAAPLLAERKGTAIVLVSRAARACYPQSLAYGAVKAGVAYLVQGTAREWATHGVQVMGFSPGAVATPMRRACFPDENPATILQPEDAAQAILALLDPRLRRATGSIIDFPW
jgi:NAD(P)-dependent dehydrogenase (short-subunit alcohol dehydrogenase family)